jgi:hypothetical protein
MENRKRNKRICFWMTQEEKDLIELKIKMSNLKKGEFFRKMIIDGKVEVKDIEIEKKKFDSIYNLTNEINKIGTNINQIAKHCNQIGSVSYEEYANVKERIEEIWQLLKTTLYEV